MFDSEGISISIKCTFNFLVLAMFFVWVDRLELKLTNQSGSHSPSGHMTVFSHVDLFGFRTFFENTILGFHLTGRGKFHHDLMSRSKRGIMIAKGNHSQMTLIQVSENLPRLDDIPKYPP